MQIVPSFLILFFFSIISFGQSNNKLDSIINYCLYSYISHNNYHLENKANLNVDFKNFYIVIDFLPNNFKIDTLITNLNISTINFRNETKYNTKILKKGISAIMFEGIRINKNELKVSFSTQFVTLIKTKNVLMEYTDFESIDEYNDVKKHKYIKSGTIGGGASFNFEFSCETKDWIFIKAEYW